jgi:zinc protease
MRTNDSANIVNGNTLIRHLWETVAIGVAVAILAVPCVAAQAGAHASQTTAEAGRLALDPAITAGTLSNGLHYYVQAHAVPMHRAELRLVVDAGSALEDSTQRGLAHFVEHMAFNGTTHFRKLDIVRYLEAMGMQFGADLNATTTFDETTYRFTIPTDRSDALPTGIRILADWAHGITFDSAAVEAERGIIMGEWRTRTDGGGVWSRVYERYLGELLRGSRYTERMPIGLPRIIETAPRSEIARFYHDWYRPDRMTVIVVGDVDVKAVEALIRRELGAIPAVKRGRERPSLAIPVRTTPVYSVFADPQVGDGAVAISYRICPPAHGTAMGVRQGILDRLLYLALDERLTSLSAATISSEEPVRDLLEYTVRTPARDGDTTAGLTSALSVIQQVVQHGFTADELERMRAWVLSGYEDQYTDRNSLSSSYLADAYVSTFYKGAIPPGLKKMLELADGALADSSSAAITLDELNARARAVLGQPGRVILVAASPSWHHSVPTEQDIARLADSVTRLATPVYESNLQAIPLVQAPPTPGHVDSARVLADVGAQEWVLSNGAHVILKPTDFNPGQILVSAIAPGGTSVAADSDYIEAHLASWALAKSGVGVFTDQLLQRRLHGLGLRAAPAPFIAELNQGITGSATPRNVKWLLQVMFLEFTAHRADSAAIATWRVQAREQLMTQSALAGQALRAILTSNDPQARPINAAMVDSLDVARTLAFYRARFADASAFTFYIVGAFSLDSIKPLVERYIGGLPATHAHRSWRDTGVRPATGPGAVDIDVGAAGKTRMELSFMGNMTFDAKSNMLLNALAEIAQRRLLDRLRTELHAPYGVQVNPSAAPWPYQHFELDVAFDAAPEQADSLARAAVAVLDTLRANGPTAREVADVKALEQRRIQLGQRDNGYWIEMLSNNQWNGWDYGTGLTNVDRLLDVLTPEKLQTAAKHFLDTGRVLRVALRPHKETS